MRCDTWVQKIQQTSVLCGWHLSAEHSRVCAALTEQANYCSWTEDRDGFNFGEMLIEFRRSLPPSRLVFPPVSLILRFLFTTKNCTWLMAGKTKARHKEAIGVESGETEKLRTERKWLVFLFICYVPGAVILGYIITVSVYTSFPHSGNKRLSLYPNTSRCLIYCVFTLGEKLHVLM